MFSSQALNLEARKQGRDVRDISGEIYLTQLHIIKMWARITPLSTQSPSYFVLQAKRVCLI